MEPTFWIEYLAISGIGLLLFYLLEVVLLRKSTLLRTKRYFFISAILTCLLLPAVSLALSSREETTREEILPVVTIRIDETPVISGGESGSSPMSRTELLLLIWSVGALLTTGWIASGHYRLYRLRQCATRVANREAAIYLTDEEIAPFTQGKSIYLPRSIEGSEMIDTILSHELEHIRQRHYRDITIGTILQIVQWWNPCTWGLLQDLRNNLEYLADRGVLREGIDRKAYQHLLLKCTVGRKVEVPSLSFSMQNLKNRITIMNNKKQTSKKMAIVYALVATPILALVVLAAQMVSVEQLQAAPADIAASYPEQVDSLPHFPGGDKALLRWLSAKVKYPEEAVEAGTEGTVIVSFYVEEDGTITHGEVVHSVTAALDAEALRLVSIMPKWVPGRSEGKAVRCKMIIPVIFKLTPSSSKEKEIPDQPDETPEFVGGQKAMMAWLSKNAKYPEEAQKANVTGTVYTSFVVESDGSLSDFKILKGISKSLDEEALRVVRSMPKWQPATKDGKPIATRMSVPIRFMIHKESDTK